jgi:predicted metalloprotease
VLSYKGPQQHPLVAPGIIDHAAEELGYQRDVRENYENYLQARDGKLYLVFEYRADCWSCGWHWETELEDEVR